MRTFTMDDIPVLYEDKHIIVVNKPQNIPCQEDASGDKDMLTIIKEYIKEKDNKPGNVFLGLVHRLDRVTGGVMVFAKNSKSAARLSEAIRDGDMIKKYLTVILGKLNETQGVMVNYLKKHSVTNIVYVATEATIGAKRAELKYRVLENLQDIISLVEIELVTGRSHQIRVQMEARGNPIFGDAKYGGDRLSKGHNLALWAVNLEFIHPITNERMMFVSYPPEDKEPWSKFELKKYLDYYNRN
ncbi:MAG: RluA family pseudouridine synthase [Clostridia bacterium]